MWSRRKKNGGNHEKGGHENGWKGATSGGKEKLLVNCWGEKVVKQINRRIICLFFHKHCNNHTNCKIVLHKMRRLKSANYSHN